MNRKGFTMIELLAVIILLAVILVVAIPGSLDAYRKSKLKAEDIFVHRLSNVIDEYVSLNLDTISFSPYIDEAEKEGQEKKVSVKKSIIHVSDLVENKLISAADYVNPNNKNITCQNNAEIELYKDSDLVYCHKIKALQLQCLTSDYIEYVEDKLASEIDNYISNGNPYIVDTCIWK